MTHPLARPLAAEALGSAFLAATVVGSGIMAERLADGNQALALLGNTLPTAAMLAVLILVFAPISGAHFNPAVSLVFALRGRLARVHLLLYASAQIGGALLGVALAHAMFELPAFTASTTVRAGAAQNLAEVIATFGLVGTILGTLRAHSNALPYAIALYVTAAYWFTASTSFANPALTIARCSDRHVLRNRARRRTVLRNCRDRRRASRARRLRLAAAALYGHCPDRIAYLERHRLAPPLPVRADRPAGRSRPEDLRR